MILSVGESWQPMEHSLRRFPALWKGASRINRYANLPQFDWLRAIQPVPPPALRVVSPPSPDPADPEQIKDPRRLERLFGASLRTRFVALEGERGRDMLATR
jgi:hypothetical protein